MSFTGSTHVGRQVGVRVAERLGKSLLELGGNNAIIVDERANLDLAVPAIVFGAVGTAGQRCTTHAPRVRAPLARAQSSSAASSPPTRQVRIGDPLDPATLMGPLIDAGAVERYPGRHRGGTSAGRRVLCGGRVLDRPGHFVEPAIVRASAGMPDRAHRDLRADPVPDELRDASMRRSRCRTRVAYGLSSALFTDRLQAAERFLSADGSDCGIANVNLGTSGAEIGGAFGGEKDTGGGREAGSDSWKAYMRRQTNTINWSSQLPLAQGIRFDL